MSTNDASRQDTPAPRSRRAGPLLRLLWSLDMLLLGALGALLMVNRILQIQMQVYGVERMDEISVILDLLDDMLLYDALAGVGLAVALACSAVVWAWTRLRRP